MYQMLASQEGVKDLDSGLTITPEMPEWGIYLAWLMAGNAPLPVNTTPPPSEGLTGLRVARSYFASHPVAVAFVKLTPAEQEAQIDTMTTAQMKTLLKYLTIAMSFLIKRELL